MGKITQKQDAATMQQTSTSFWMWHLLFYFSHSKLCKLWFIENWFNIL